MCYYMAPMYYSAMYFTAGLSSPQGAPGLEFLEAGQLSSPGALLQILGNIQGCQSLSIPC